MLRFILLVSAIFCSSLIVAQSENTDEEVPDKLDHFGGIQVNPLLRQILNFGDAEEITNPYLVTYTMRLNSSNLAFSAGLGHSKQRTENEDGLNATTSDFSVRAGAGQQFRLNEHFEVGYGLDLLFNDRTTTTFTTQVIEFGFGKDSTFAETNTTSRGYGAGLRVNLMFYITDRILLGTEASYTYLKSTDKFHVYVENHFMEEGIDPQVSISNENEKEDQHTYDFNLPMVLYLIIKF